MLHSLKALDGFVIAAIDGTLGRVKDIYFDDRQWAVRYLEVDTGGWITGRRVLISPLSINAIDWEGEEVSVKLTRKQVHDSPGIDTAVTVARQHEAALFNYYGYPYYWTGPYIWGYTAIPELAPPSMPPLPEQSASDTAEDDAADNSQDPHLRSKDEVVGYEIQAADEAFGRVDDFLFDERSWTMQLMVVDTRGGWWSGREVLVPPARIQSILWEEKSVVLDVTRAQVEASPEYDPRHPPAEEQGYPAISHRPLPPASAQDAGARTPPRL